MKNFVVFFLFLVLGSCTKELLHEPGVPWLEIKEVNSTSTEKVKASVFSETKNVEALRFTLKAHERDMFIPSGEMSFESITSTRDVKDVISSVKLLIGGFAPLFCSEDFPSGSEVNLPPVPYRIEIKKDSTIQVVVYITIKKIDDIYNIPAIFSSGTKLRVLLSSVRAFDMDSSQIKGIYGSAWGSWIEFSK